MRVNLSTSLETDADSAWGLVQDTSTFLHVTRGLLRWADSDHLPEKWYPGGRVRSQLFFFGFLPGWVHELQITRIDDQRRELQTAEHGGLLRAWNHSIRVEPEGQARCRYTDSVEIQAGPWTPLVWLCAQLFFRYRQMRLRGYARRHGPGTAPETGAP
jgi:hypothetical protein